MFKRSQEEMKEIFPPDKRTLIELSEQKNSTEGEFVKYVNSKNGQVGETASGLMLASARGLAKLAAYMANRGQLDGQVMFSEASWDEMHAEPTTEVMYGGGKSIITKAGFCLYEFPEQEEQPHEDATEAKKLSKDEKIIQKT